MEIPLYIKADNPPTGSGVPNGIISNIRKKVGLEKIEKIVIPSTNKVYPTNEFDITNVLTWAGLWSSAQNIDSYLQLEFKNRYVYPTHYSIRGNSEWEYPKEWRLYGFNKIGEPMTLISENKSLGSTYCAGGSYCASSNWGTFQIIKKVKPFRYFRFTIKTPSTSRPFMNFCGVEVFGIYSNKLDLNSKQKSRLSVLMLLRLFISYIIT